MSKSNIGSEVGEVVGIEGGVFAVRVDHRAGRWATDDDGSVRAARRAVSCLVEPQIGDRVELVGRPGEVAYVLHVLRAASPEVVVAASGGRGITVETPGKFTVAARDGVGVVSAGDAAVVARTLDVRSGGARLSLRRLVVAAKSVKSELEAVAVVGTSLDRVAERVVKRVKRVLRRVDEEDQLRVERLEITAKREMSLHAADTMITADGLVKADAEQIQVG